MFLHLDHVCDLFPVTFDSEAPPILLRRVQLERLQPGSKMLPHVYWMLYGILLYMSSRSRYKSTLVVPLASTLPHHEWIRVLWGC